MCLFNELFSFVIAFPAFLMMYSANKLNSKQGGNIHKQYAWCTPFPIWSQSAVPCLVLTDAS